jgi:hypothetical protein
MVGVVTRNEPEVSWSEFGRVFYEVKSVSGRASEPVAGAITTLSTFADNAAARENPDLVPVSRDGQRATRGRPHFDWAHVCPTHEQYREGLLEMIADAGETSGDVRLDDVGFPREEYCYGDRCNSAFEESAYDDRLAWRASVVTDFLAAARERVPGELFLTLYPDPYPGHLYERSGIDIEAVAEYVDEFVVPLYDTEYATTYWLETIARGFRTRLGGDYDVHGAPPETPFSLELYAVDVAVDDLIHATEVAETYAKDVFFGYDANNAAAALRRKDADGRDGEVHRPD